MKNRILSLLLFLLAAVNMHAAEGITVRFDVKNPVLSNVVLVYHMSVNEFPLTDGKATVQLDGMDALYANVYYGEKTKNVYLQKGDDVTISFDANDFDNTFAVKGGNEKAIDYLNKIQLTGLSNEAYIQPWSEFKATVDKKDSFDETPAEGTQVCCRRQIPEDGRRQNHLLLCQCLLDVSGKSYLSHSGYHSGIG